MKRTKHNLSHYRLLTADMGKLVPVSCVETLPGDTFQQNSSALIRVSPLVAPVMHPVQVRLHHFFVPNRLLWDGWENFITGNDNTTAPPTVTLGSSEAGKISDYLGVPPVSGLQVSAMPFRAYNMIYNEYFRDQDLVTEISQDSTELQNCSWEKDYFASARPWSQKGDAVTIPIAGKVPVIGIGGSSLSYSHADVAVRQSNGEGVNYLKSKTISSSSSLAGDSINIEEDPNNPGFPNIYADLEKAEAVEVNEFRKAFALQRYQEARARYGSRYTEYLQYLGIRPSDARLQRPEYLGGGKQTIAFSEVLRTGSETGATDDTKPIGEMAGHGIAAMRTNRYRKFFEEHGFVITLMSVRPRAMYTQNLPKKWSRLTKEDYFQKELEAIGQQEIYNKEIYADASADDDTVFGYADRYREYREEQSSVSAEFRNTLNYWHMARDFSSRPALNQTFTDCVPTKRIHAEQTKHSLWIMVNHHIGARRMVNKHANARIL